MKTRNHIAHLPEGAGTPSSPCHGMSRNRMGTRTSPPLSAFSLVEILVAVSLLSFIVLGLLMMFNQTQRAFRGSMTQSDVLESGRLVTDMISRELEQAAPSKGQPIYYKDGVYVHTNFFAELFWPPSIQGLPGSSAFRTNTLQRFFFMSRENQEWTGIGYVVLTNYGASVGTLYRFSATKRPPFQDYDLSAYFQSEVAAAMSQITRQLPVTRSTLSRVADGVVHMRVNLSSADGRQILPLWGTNLVVRLSNGNLGDVQDTYWGRGPISLPNLPEFAGYYFFGDAIPGSVELEIGFLEQNILGHYKALQGNITAQSNYLSNHVANVHIFRQRIPLRNVEPSVYP